MKIEDKKTKMFNVKINEKEYGVIKVLRERYAVNVSTLFRNTIRQKLEELESNGR